MINIRYRDPNELSPGLHAEAERHGRTTTVYLLPGLTDAQRRAALRRLRISARRGYGPRLPGPALALALLGDRIRITLGRAGAVFRSHPAGSTVPVMVLSAGAIAFLALSAVSIQVIHRPGDAAPPSFSGVLGDPGPAASVSLRPRGSPGPAGAGPAGAGDQPGPAAEQPGQGGSGSSSGGQGSGGAETSPSTSQGAGTGSDPTTGSGQGTTMTGGKAPTPTPAPSATDAAPTSSAAAPTPSATTSKPSPTASASTSKSNLCVNVGSLGLCV